jgi:hypothetical protein
MNSFDWLYQRYELFIPLTKWQIYDWISEIYWRIKFKIPYPTKP